jgi:hypothetical protein
VRVFCELHAAQLYGPTRPLSKWPTCQQVLNVGLPYVSYPLSFIN